MNILRLSLLCLLTFLTSSLLSEADNAQHSSTSNLAFGTKKGSDVLDSEVTTFINFINSGSVFYPDDFAQRYAFLRGQMNAIYGKEGYSFSIFEDASASSYDWTVNEVYNHYASISSGHDRVFPNKSYMFARQPISNNDFLALAKVGDKGVGVTQAIETAIKNAVFSAETRQVDSCDCGFLKNAQEVSSLMNDYDGGSWNAFCSSSPMLGGSMSAYKSIGVYTKPKNCYYLLYRTS